MKKPNSPLSLTDLPYDCQAIVLSKVAEESHPDLVQCIFACKTFRDLSKYPIVLKNLNLYLTFPLPMRSVPAKLKFLYECADHGNMHAIFLCGVTQYYFLKKTESGKRKLMSAAEADHPEAMYMYGMILISENQLMEGSNYLMKLWKEKGLQAVRLCNENCRNLVLELSVKQYREYEFLLAVMDLGDGCEVGDYDEVCDKCFTYKEIYRFADYMNIN